MKLNVLAIVQAVAGWVLAHLFGEPSIFESERKQRAREWWERLAGHTCKHAGCDALGIACYLPDWGDEQHDRFEPDAWYCTEHARAAGFCYLCGNFYGGIESFDFGPGYCDNCVPEFEREYEDAFSDDDYRDDYDDDF